METQITFQIKDFEEVRDFARANGGNISVLESRPITVTAALFNIEELETFFEQLDEAGITWNKA